MSSSKKIIVRSGWLMKNEPTEFSISDLVSQGIGRWDGIRNYQARNYLKDMKVGERAFFYHSSCPQPGIYGTMTIAKTFYPDPLALDKKSHYYDHKATEENNPWVSVDVAIEQKYDKPLLLDRIRELSLGPCPLTARGNRLSIIPLTEEQVRIFDEEA
jgi:predicted RNA-binding protein with PUA-like domain